MSATDTFDEVLQLVQKLSLAEKARLLAFVTPQITAAIVDQAASETAEPAAHTPDSLPPDSPAGRMARDPHSALAQVLALKPESYVPPSDEEVARWRDERIRERLRAS